MGEILIAGAGPAGLVAAIQLARSGRRVMIIAPPANDHKIGECVPGEINHLLKRLDFPLISDASGVHRRIGGKISLWAGAWGSEDSISQRNECHWRLNRVAFENSLESLAASFGIERRFGRVRVVHRSVKDRWKIQTDNGCSVEADWIVDATGRAASIARKQRAERKESTKLIAIWSIGTNAQRDFTTRTLIESQTDGWWYAAYLPDGRPIAIFHTSPEFAMEMKKNPSLWRSKLGTSLSLGEYVSSESFNEKNLRASNATPGQLEPCFGDRWVACGDAALSFDPIAAHGIFNSVMTGSMVADALISGQEDSLVIYQTRLRELSKKIEKRRSLYYESASIFFQSSFWLNRV